MLEKRELTTTDIDKVRQIEGFPIAKDEDIIALSDAPYYTACPNPFIEEFIRENGMPYDEASDDYHCEPFAADVSEGKNDPIYNAHSYHTKVPKLLERTVRYPGFYLDKTYQYLICKGDNSFDINGENVMTHGGITIEEVIVPFIRIRREGKNG